MFVLLFFIPLVTPKALRVLGRGVRRLVLDVRGGCVRRHPDDRHLQRQDEVNRVEKNFFFSLSAGALTHLFHKRCRAALPSPVEGLASAMIFDNMASELSLVAGKHRQTKGRQNVFCGQMVVGDENNTNPSGCTCPKPMIRYIFFFFSYSRSLTR